VYLQDTVPLFLYTLPRRYSRTQSRSTRHVGKSENDRMKGGDAHEKQYNTTDNILLHYPNVYAPQLWFP
jgi:hypothetical protein